MLRPITNENYPCALPIPTAAHFVRNLIAEITINPNNKKNVFVKITNNQKMINNSFGFQNLSKIARGTTLNTSI